MGLQLGSLNGSAEPALSRDRQPIHLIESWKTDGNGGNMDSRLQLAGAASPRHHSVVRVNHLKLRPWVSNHCKTALIPKSTNPTSLLLCLHLPFHPYVSAPISNSGNNPDADCSSSISPAAEISRNLSASSTACLSSWLQSRSSSKPSRRP